MPAPQIGRPDLRARVSSTAPTKSWGAEGEQEVEEAVAPIIEIPAGLAKEAVKGAVVFVVAELSGLDDAGKGAAAAAQHPGTAQAAKGVEAGLGKAGFKGEQQGGEGADQQIGHRRRSP